MHLLPKYEDILYGALNISLLKPLGIAEQIVKNSLFLSYSIYALLVSMDAFFHKATLLCAKEPASVVDWL